MIQCRPVFAALAMVLAVGAPGLTWSQDDPQPKEQQPKDEAPPSTNGQVYVLKKGKKGVEEPPKAPPPATPAERAIDPGAGSRPVQQPSPPVTIRILNRSLGEENVKTLLKEMESSKSASRGSEGGTNNRGYPATGQGQSSPQGGSPGSGPAPVQPPASHLRIGQSFLDHIDFERFKGANGQGAPNSNQGFDGAAPRAGFPVEPPPSGTPFFSGRRPPVTREAVDTILRDKGSIPGGVALDGAATGLGSTSSISYDARFNAVMFDDRAALFLRVPPKTFATLCRAIAQDEKERVGVSLGDQHVVYGKVPKESDLAWDMKLADNFLGDVVFVLDDEDHWTEGYKFARGYKPKKFKGRLNQGWCVFFEFNQFEFKVDREVVQLKTANLDVRFIPLSDAKAADGGFLPDGGDVSRIQAPQEWRDNADHLTSNLAYYLRERIVAKMFAYGETASVIRALKAEGFDLEALADRIEKVN